MPSFSPECRAFLLDMARTAQVATVRADGRPHVAPVWFDLDGDTLIFTTGETTVKDRNIAWDGRVCICVDDERPPFAYVQIEGVATLHDNLDELLHWATRIGGRYMGEAQAEAHGKRNGVAGELLVRVTPTKIHFVQDVAGW